MTQRNSSIPLIIQQHKHLRRWRSSSWSSGRHNLLIKHLLAWIFRAMSEFRIALSKEIYPNCTFAQRSPCFEHPWIVELSLAFDAIFKLAFSNYGNNYTLHLIPADNVSHSIEMVRLDQADFSSNYAELTWDRATMYHHLGPLFPVENEFIFLSDSSISITLNLFDIFPLNASLLGGRPPIPMALS